MRYVRIRGFVVSLSSMSVNEKIPKVVGYDIPRMGPWLPGAPAAPAAKTREASHVRDHPYDPAPVLAIPSHPPCGQPAGPIRG